MPKRTAYEPPKSELDEIQQRTKLVQNSSLESTRRMVQMMEESKEAAIKTLVMLDEQGEQLERIEKDDDRISQVMKEAEKNLKDLSKCCGLCVLPWKRFHKKLEKQDDNGTTRSATKPNDDDDDNNNNNKLSVNGPRKTIGDPVNPVHKGIIARITHDPHEDEMEENLVQISSMIGNMRNIAIDLGTEVDSQNHLVARIADKTSGNTERVINADLQAKNIKSNK